MKVVLPLPDGPPISACGGWSPRDTSTGHPSGPSPTGATRPSADRQVQKRDGRRSANFAGGGPSAASPASSRHSAVTLAGGGGGSRCTTSAGYLLTVAVPPPVEAMRHTAGESATGSPRA